MERELKLDRIITRDTSHKFGKCKGWKCPYCYNEKREEGPIMINWFSSEQYCSNSDDRGNEQSFWCQSGVFFDKVKETFEVRLNCWCESNSKVELWWLQSDIRHRCNCCCFSKTTIRNSIQMLETDDFLDYNLPTRMLKAIKKVICAIHCVRCLWLTRGSSFSYLPKDIIIMLLHNVWKSNDDDAWVYD